MKFGLLIRSIFNRLKRASIPGWMIPLGLLVICILSFGLLIPSLGFYLDDWYTIWFAKTLGVSSYPAIYAEDRPFLAYFYMAAVTFLGQTPLAWQIFNIFCRTLAGAAVWGSLRQVWPGASQSILLVAITFIVYPGFKQHWISVSFSPWYLFLAFYLFSIGGMILSIRKRKWYWLWTPISLALSVYTLLSTEYYFGLELLRPVFLWIVFSATIQNKRERAGKTILHWLPYLGGFLAYWIWRTFFFVSTHYSLQAIQEISAHPFTAILGLFSSLATYAYHSFWTAWSQIFTVPYSFDLSQRPALLFWGVVVLAGLFTAIFCWGIFAGFTKKGFPRETKNFRWQLIGVGILALLVGGIPFWAAGLSVTTEFPWDRFTLAMMLGASLLLVGVIEAFLRPVLPKIILVAVIVGLATGANFQLSRDYHLEWAKVQDFYWQLSWRAPGIQKDTILLTHSLGLNYEREFLYFNENSLTALLNWVYSPENNTAQFDYFVYFSNAVDGGGLLKQPMGSEVTRKLRTASFTGSTSQILGVYFAADGCLQVLDQTGETLPMLPNDLLPALSISNTDLILPDPDSPLILPPDLFGEEPAHGWCYYYEKAELARQMGDWQEVVDLGTQVEASGLEPAWLSEWLPFIEGYAHLGNFQKAEDITFQAMEGYPLMASGVCRTWARISEETQPDADQLLIIQQVLDQTNCY